MRLPELKPRARYSYRVKASASAAEAWSDAFEFRAPYGHTAVTAELPTRVAIYGDMGNYAKNNMANLQRDCETSAVDAIVHMGDRA